MEQRVPSTIPESRYRTLATSLRPLRPIVGIRKNASQRHMEEINIGKIQSGKRQSTIDSIPSNLLAKRKRAPDEIAIVLSFPLDLSERGKRKDPLTRWDGMTFFGWFLLVGGQGKNSKYSSNRAFVNKRAFPHSGFWAFICSCYFYNGYFRIFTKRKNAFAS